MLVSFLDNDIDPILVVFDINDIKADKRDIEYGKKLIVRYRAYK